MKNHSVQHTQQALFTVDIVLLTLVDGDLHTALFKREQAPFEGQWALPGGFIHIEEDDSAKAAAARVLGAKTGLNSPYLEEYGTFSGPARDPRGWSLSVVYYALIPASKLPDMTPLFPVEQLPSLPFDHSSIVSAVVHRVRSKAAYSSLPVHLCVEPFTIPELHQVYERILGAPLNMANFRRKLDDLNLLEAIPGATRLVGRSRPSQLYQVSKRFRHALSFRDRGL